MIFLLIFFLYSATLFRMSVPLTGDQKVYLSIALEMREKGSFLTPYLFDHVNFLKPPFQYWMTLLGWNVFGFNLFGSFLPSVIALVISAFLVKRLSKGNGQTSAIVFASTLATMTYGTTAQMEIWVVAFYLGAWLFYLEKKLFLSFVLVGIMAWVKGPLYPVLFVLSIIAKAYFDGEIKMLFSPKFILSLFTGVIIGLLWYFAVATQHYQELRDVFFGRENFEKIQTAQGTPWGLWSEFIATLFPVVFLMIASGFDSKTGERFRESKIFWLAYAVIPALFFTFFPYRVNTYLYLLTPIFAWMVLETPNPPRWMRFAIFGTTLIIAAMGSLLSFRLVSGSWISVGTGIALSAILCFWSYCHFQLKGNWIAISSLILVCLIRYAATDIGEWDLQPLRNEKFSQLAYFIPPDQEDIWHEFGLISVALGRPILRVKDDAQAVKFLSEGGSIVFSDEQNAISGTTCDPWRRLKRRIKFPFRSLLMEGLSIEEPRLHRNFQICKVSK